jgi:Uri superfamily endonuclease
LKGIYVLIICLNKDAAVKIGALGKITFKRGRYAYVGSAQKNLEQRVQRHLRKEKKKFWHIDYLLDRDATRIVKVFHKQASKAEECRIANELSLFSASVIGFGCSDCHCKSHLFHVVDTSFLQEYIQASKMKLAKIRHKEIC